MYGLIVKLMLHPGKRDEMIEILQANAAGMPGCYSYVVAKDKSDEDVLWVTEVWDREESHHASLALPAVKATVPRAKPLVANFERIAVTEPIWGHRLKEPDEKFHF
jgi:quinol monooxygenase YgiN